MVNRIAVDQNATQHEKTEKSKLATVIMTLVVPNSTFTSAFVAACAHVSRTSLTDSDSDSSPTGAVPEDYS